MKVLIFGDVIGKLGRRGIAAALPELKKKHGADLTLANVENLAHGKGVTPATLEELKEAGVDVFTSGNHIWAKPDGVALLDDPEVHLLRPANYPAGSPGNGAELVSVGDHKVLVVNLLGRAFMKESADDPFRTLDRILEEFEGAERAATIVDFHAEVTSEKVALGLYADGRVSAFYGTHTHVPTNDAELLPEGTAYCTDAGMVGGQYTVIGVEKTNPIKGFLTQRPQSWEYPETGKCWVNGLVVTIDPKTQKATAIEQIRELVEI